VLWKGAHEISGDGSELNRGGFWCSFGFLHTNKVFLLDTWPGYGADYGMVIS
jgi:hypothetical protein